MIRLHHTPTKNVLTVEADRLYIADAFDVLPLCEDNSCDLIICDGPYGITANDWDQVGNIQEFNLNLIKIFSQKLKFGGALYLFGKPNCIDFIRLVSQPYHLPIFLVDDSTDESCSFQVALATIAVRIRHYPENLDLCMEVFNHHTATR